MIKTILLSAATLLFAVSSQAQTQAKSQTKILKKSLELKMPKTVDDDMPGTRGAAVVWHPVQKKYYAAFAGNYGYPLAVFDATGKRLSKDTLITMFDIRGMWYNPTKKTIQMNGYNEGGWAEYILDSKGIPTDKEVMFEGMNQPNDQSTGFYNTRDKFVYFLNDDGNLAKYEGVSAEYEKDITLNLGKTEEDDEFENADVIDDYNTAATYTDMPGSEIALLNHYEKKIEIYSLRTGYKVKEFSLPEEATIESRFNFSYSNGIYWLFDMKKRTWFGYR